MRDVLNCDLGRLTSIVLHLRFFARLVGFGSKLIAFLNSLVAQGF